MKNIFLLICHALQSCTAHKRTQFTGLASSKRTRYVLMYICIYIVESTKKARGHTQKANLEKAAYPVAAA